MLLSDPARAALIKVPAVTLGFCIIKILATTLGETVGDTVSMSMNLGYLVGGAIFLGPLVILPLGAAVGDFLDKPVTRRQRCILVRS